MKTLFTTAAAVVFSTAALAGPLDENTTYGSILFDLAQSSPASGGYTEPTGPVANVLYSSDTFGSVLYDLDTPAHEHELGSPPAIGDDADDYGSVLYDNGARY